jgi:hypothetical protein
MTAFWDITPCSLNDGILMMEAVCTSETSTSTRLHGAISQKAVIFKLKFHSPSEPNVSTCPYFPLEHEFQKNKINTKLTNSSNTQNIFYF